MRLAQHVIILVVGRRHLQTTRTELNLYVAVLDDGNHTVHERHNHLAAFQPLVLRILRVDTHGGIAHDSLRTCCCYDSIVAAFLVLVQNFALFACRNNRVSVGICYIVAKVEELALLVAVDNLLGRENCLSLRIPVYHAQTAVDESLVVKVNEHLHNAFRTLLVHCEGCSVPVA